MTEEESPVDISEQDKSIVKGIIGSAVHIWVLKSVATPSIGTTIFHYRQFLNHLILVSSDDDPKHTAATCMTTITKELGFNKWKTEKYGRNRLPLTPDRLKRFVEYTRNVVSEYDFEELFDTIEKLNPFDTKQEKGFETTPYDTLLMVLSNPSFHRLFHDTDEIDVPYSALQGAFDAFVVAWLTKTKTLPDIKTEFIYKEQELKAEEEAKKKKTYKTIKAMKEGKCMVNVNISGAVDLSGNDYTPPEPKQ